MGDQCVFQNPDMSFMSRLLAYLGILFIVVVGARFLQSVCRGLYHCFLGQWLGHNVDFRKFKGKWAVITGASDGIGRAYAEELASKGLNVVLLSRTQSKLEDVASCIQQKFKVETKILAVDFSSTDHKVYDVIKEFIADLEVAVLVNNVGMSFAYPEYFTLVPDAEVVMDQIIQANCVAATRMILMLLPAMTERKTGVIINVSSLSGLHPLPLLSVYAGTKAYLEFVSQAVNLEYKDFGIIVQSVKPAFVSTKMSKIRRSSINVPTPEAYVKQAITTVGLEASTYGYIPHKIRGYLQEAAFNALPLHCMLKSSLRTVSSMRNGRYRKNKMDDPFKKAKTC